MFLKLHRGTSVLSSGGAEHEDVVRDESWHRVWSDLLHESQDRYERQQWLHERPYPFPLQEHPPPSHWKHIHVMVLGSKLEETRREEYLISDFLCVFLESTQHMILPVPLWTAWRV